MTPPVVEARGLRKQFGDKLAVADLSLSVGSGEVFGFLGPNGAGKTTSLKMLLGLLRPTAGSAVVLGAPLGDLRARAGIGFLPEHFRFHDWLTGRELLRYHARLYGVPRARREDRIEALLARVDLLDAAGRRLRDYSKGMLQRIGLAQALLNEPRLVFLDEPTSGLDPLGRLLVRDIIRELKAAGTAVFLNSHLLGEVEATCDRVVFVKDGRAVHELVLGSAERDLELELRVGPIPPETLAGLGRFGSGVRAGDGVVRLVVRAEEELPRLARWLVEQEVDLYRMQAHRKSLETLFLEVMGEDQRPG
ncbi:MAG TPA: ABC transporter ATP-binding protein [Candidatus Saccharimonadales bacterium]|nr:ABC transporter ATP-binding protein [Candidatus Saccharimonadales bacterium]